MPLTSFYSIVRYVPNLIRDEGINIGVVLEIGSNGRRTIAHQFTENFQRAAKIDPFIRTSVLERNVKNAVDQILGELDSLSLSRVIESHGGGKIQFTPPRLTLVDHDSIEQEISELYDQFVWEDREARHQGISDIKLRQKVVSTLYRVDGLDPEKVKVNTKNQPVEVRGDRFNHKFDLSVQFNGRPDFVRLLSFDVEHHLEKLESAKALVFDASDIEAAKQHIGVYSVLYPPKSKVAARRESFLEAQAILRDREIPAFDFNDEQDIAKFVRALRK